MIFTDIIIHTWEKGAGGRPSLQERFDMRSTCGPYHLIPTAPGDDICFYQSSQGLAMGDGRVRLRLTLANDILKGRWAQGEITGYYTDDYETETMVPIIARLNHERGFLAGWTMGRGGLALLMGQLYTTEVETARAAHHKAEYDAERERDHEREERARLDAEEEEEERLKGGDIA